MLALYQPAARDLRFVTGVMKIINDQERVGDLAVNVAERACAIADLPPRDAPPAFVEMADRVRAMLTAALDALVRQDPKRAIEVLKMDERVDALLKDVYERTHPRCRGTRAVSFSGCTARVVGARTSIFDFPALAVAHRRGRRSTSSTARSSPPR